MRLFDDSVRGAALAIGFLSCALIATVHAQDPAAPAATTTPPQDVPPPQTQAAPKQVQATVNLDELLADPINKRPDLKSLIKARVALAHKGGDPAAFEAVAQDFAKRSAWYPAISILWFAEKLTDDAETRRGYGEKMQMWLQKSEEIETQLGAASQILAANRVDEGIKQINKIRLDNPLSEKAAFQAAQAYYNLYASHDIATKGELPLETRLRLFRIMFEQYSYTLVIDPMYVEGYYGLSKSRDVLADSPAFVQRTEAFSQKSMDFEKIAVPMIAKLDEGDRSAATLEAAADALNEVAVYPYAAFLYQAALRKQDVGERAVAIQTKLTALLTEKIPPGSAPSPAMPPKAEAKPADAAAAPADAAPAPAPAQ